MPLSHLGFFGKEVTKFCKSRSLDSLILFVTSRCNVSCDFCFYKKELNQHNDLALEEFRRISDSIGSLKGLLFSGGEPYLRNDLVEIAEAFITKCKVEAFQIPTNGFLTDRVLSFTEQIITKFPKLNHTVAVSLDALGDTHDLLRHQKGLFDRAIATLNGLARLRNENRSFRIMVVSVLTPENISSYRELAKYVREKIKPDLHWFEPIRDNTNVNRVIYSESTLSFLRQNLEYYWRNAKGSNSSIYSNKLMNNLITEFNLNNFNIAYDNANFKKTWPMPCTAGRKIAVVYPNGELAACELRNTLTNLKDFNYDLRKALESDLFKAEIKKISQKGCDCTHGCFITNSIRYSATQSIKNVLRSFFVNRHPKSHNCFKNEH